MTTFDKLADTLGMTKEDKEELFQQLVDNDISLDLWFYEDGTVDWGIKLH